MKLSPQFNPPHNSLMIVLNWILLLIQSIGILTLAANFLLRDRYNQISESIYGGKAPFMNSWIADFVFRPKGIAIVTLIIAASIWKEFKLISLTWRIIANGGIIILLALLH